MTIYKYQIPIADKTLLRLPQHHAILHVGEQPGFPRHLMLWAQVEETEPPVTLLTVSVYGTGHPCDHDWKQHFATVPMSNGLVWHVFIDGGNRK
jgi:hypothetical protein